MKFTRSRPTLLALALVATAIFPFSRLPLAAHAQPAAGRAAGEGKPHIAQTRKEYENGLIHSKSGHLRGLQSLTLQATGLWKDHGQDPV